MFTHVNEFTFPDLKSEQTTSGKRYYYTPNGDKYPSVTTVLSSKPKPTLENWKLMLGDKKAKQEQERCSERGTNVHSLIEKFLMNEENFSKGFKPEYVRLFNQLKPYLNKINNIRGQEIALWSDRLKLAGRVDCVGEYKGKLAIIDFKTSNNNKSSDSIEDYYIQCTAYAIMWHEMTGEPIENIVVLMTVEKGLIPLIFEKEIEDYVKPLLIRISDFYKDNK